MTFPMFGGSFLLKEILNNNNNNDNNKYAFYSAQYPKASGRFTDKNICRMHIDNNEVKNIHEIHKKENMIMHKNSLKPVKKKKIIDCLSNKKGYNSLKRHVPEGPLRPI